MASSVEGWSLMTTPMSFLGVSPLTRIPFSYFITFQALGVGALYHRKKVKPFLAFIGVASLIMLDIYDMYYAKDLHNFFAIVFFLVQPIIFLMEYKKKKDPYEITKVGVLLLLILLTYLELIPLPIFEVLSYALLILFL
tara:strand:- start:367 stop:783 length:417 start_codon:yes stop_codon:yes gene_type:complete